MAKVNLLPWRAERRKARQREFYSMLAAAAIGALVLGLLISFYYSEQVDGQKRRNDYLTQKIAELDKKIEEIQALDQEKERLLRRKEVIEQLQANRSQIFAIQRPGQRLHAQHRGVRMDDESGPFGHRGRWRRQDASLQVQSVVDLDQAGSADRTRRQTGHRT
jgi:hypothetical protein